MPSNDLLNRAWHYQQTCQYAQAIEAYRQWLDASPNDPMVWHWLGAALQAEGRLDEAIEAARRRVGLQPDDAQAHLALGDRLRTAGQLDEARSACAHAHKLAPDDTGCALALARIHQTCNEYEQAIEIGRAIAEQDEHNIEALELLAASLDRCGDEKQAAAVRARMRQLQFNVDDRPTEATAPPPRAATTRPRILLITNYDPRQQPSIGVTQRLAHHVRALAAFGDVSLLQPTIQPTASELGLVDGDVDPAVHMEAASNAAAACWRLDQHQPDTPAARELRDTDPNSFDIVFVHRLHPIWWTGWVDPARTIVDLDDLPSHYYRQVAEQSEPARRASTWQQYLRVRAGERRLPRWFRYLLVCSEPDRAEFDQPNVITVPNVYSPRQAMNAFQPNPDSRTILCLGTLAFGPNVHGVGWFVANVLPRLRAEDSRITLTVAGLTPPERTGDWSWVDQPGVHFLGTVDDVDACYRDAAMTICPLWYGRGTRIRIVESLAFGLPVVSTPIGAHGLPMDESHGLHRCVDADAFAAACMQLLADPAAGLQAAQQGRAAVAAHFSPQAAAATLHRLCQNIIDNPDPTVSATQSPARSGDFGSSSGV